ncbi:MAG TPA: MFS transporter [Thermomicrobiales bacterium]|nr:MFS transporter [Thermomicrobiales bacterium]
MARSSFDSEAPSIEKQAPQGIFTSLKLSRQFRFLWVSNLFFFGGAWTQTLVLAWLVLEMTGSPFYLALFTAVRLAPLLLGPFSGVISDRFDRVRLLLGACTWTLCAVSVVATIVTLDRAPYWVLVLGGLAIGLGQSPSQPSRSSLVLDLVNREHLSNANALNSMAMNMTQVIGPAAGGAMISTFGAPSALWISTAWYAIALVALLPLRSMKTSRQAHHEPAIGMLVHGFRTILSSRLSAAVLGVTLCANILIWPIYQAFVPVFAVDILGLDAAGLGWMLTCVGVGGLTGSLIIASLGDFRFKGGLFVLGTGAWGVLWALFGMSTSTPLSFVLMIMIGVMSASFGVLQTTLLLMTTDPAVQGRALGLQELAIGIMPISALVLGTIADRVGVGPTTTVCGFLLAVCMLTIAARVPALLRYG